MSRHDSLIIKDTHRGLLYEDGVFRDVLPAGRYQIPRPPSSLATFFGAKAPKVEVVLVDVRGRDRTIIVQDLLTADGATITASFVVQFRVEDPRAATHQVKNFEDRLYAEAQTAARRALRGMSVEEVLGSRDEIGEELLRIVKESASLYGLEVTGLDFKDLIIPEKLQEIMNHAVLAKRLRQVQVADGLFISEDDDDEDEDGPFVAAFEGDHSASDTPDDPDLIVARAAFGRPRESDRDRDLDYDRQPRPERLLIRPHQVEPRGNGFYGNSLDIAMRRARS